MNRPADSLEAWIADPDTIPKPIIKACRDAICLEFGNNGTDGYYKRILAKVFRSIQTESHSVLREIYSRHEACGRGRDAKTCRDDYFALLDQLGELLALTPQPPAAVVSCNCKVSVGLASFHEDDCRVMSAAVGVVYQIRLIDGDGSWRDITRHAYDAMLDDEAYERRALSPTPTPAAVPDAVRGLDAITAEWVIGYLPATAKARGSTWQEGYNDAVRLCREEIAHAFAEWAALSAAPESNGDGMLPDALVPHADEWYRLCERRFAVDKITISGPLAEAIVSAISQQDGQP